MDFVILDLEWNGSYSRKMKKYINEIFEFGAVRVNDKMEIVDTFSMLIKPQIGKKICDRVKRLTHIDTEELSPPCKAVQFVFQKRCCYDMGCNGYSDTYFK